MAGNIFLQANSLATLLDDTALVAGNNSLTSLASGAGAITTSPGVDNTSRLDKWCDLEFTGVWGVANAPTAGKTIDVYFLPSYDGTNYDDGAAGATPVTSSEHYRGSFVVRAITTAQRLVLRGLPIPPDKFNVLLVNNTDKALAATGSGSRLKIMTYQEQYT